MIHNRQGLPFGLETAITWRMSMPGLIIFSATRRLTGSFCSAMSTTPMPPSPLVGHNQSFDTLAQRLIVAAGLQHELIACRLIRQLSGRLVLMMP